MILFFVLNIFKSFSLSEPPKDPSVNGTSNKQIPHFTVKPSLPKSKTQISSVYTKLSSIKPTNTNPSSNANIRNSSIPNYVNAKTVKTTQIGSSHSSPTKVTGASNAARSPKRNIPQLVKPQIGNGSNKTSSKSLLTFMPKSSSNGSSATSSLSTNSSNSSLNTNGNNLNPVRNFV